MVVLIPCTRLPNEWFIDIQTAQIIRADRAATNFGSDVVPVVEKLGRDAVDRLARPAAEGIVGEGRETRGIGETGETISRVPLVCRGPIARQIAIGIVRERRSRKRRLLICSVVAG